MFECVRANHRAALELSAEILRRAEAVQSDDLLIAARLAMGISNFFLGEPADAITKELIPLCTAENIPVFLAHGRVLAAWSLCAKGDAEGPAAMQAALDEFRATGSRCFLPHWDAFHAGALSAAGEHVQAAER